MPRGRPWYKRDPERFIMGSKGLDLEAYGAYSKIVDYLNLRDRSLPDDDRLMASLLDCPKQRWRKLRKILIDAGKLVTNGEYLTNPRFEREKAERDLSRAEAQVHGREGGRRSAELRQQPELELGQYPPERAPARESDPKVATKFKESSKKVETLLESQNERLTPLSMKSAKKNQGNPQAPYAGARESEDKSIESSQPNPPYDPELQRLFADVCDAAGFRPTGEVATERAYRTIVAWRDKEIDFELVVIPTIKSVIASSNEGPTRVLSRFTPHIANEQAKRKAKPTTYRPPLTPVLERSDEGEEFSTIRRILLQALGPSVYASYFNDLRMIRDEEDDLIIIGRFAGPLRTTTAFASLEAVARRFKFRWIKDYDRLPRWLEGERKAALGP